MVIFARALSTDNGYYRSMDIKMRLGDQDCKHSGPAAQKSANDKNVLETLSHVNGLKWIEDASEKLANISPTLKKTLPYDDYKPSQKCR